MATAFLKFSVSPWDIMKRLDITKLKQMQKHWPEEGLTQA
jgi:hypothetical protein